MTEALRGDSFTGDRSWKIRITDKTDMTADKTPSRDRTIRDLWLYLSDIFASLSSGFLPRLNAPQFLIRLHLLPDRVRWHVGAF